MDNFQSLSISAAGADLILDPDRALYWPEKEVLFLTDLHFGKVSHFHKAGISIPGQMINEDYSRLNCLMQRYQIKQWICLGDLFHSHWNQEHTLFLQWRAYYPHVKMTLIEGNHDHYMRKHYDQLDLEIYPHLDLDPFYLIHDWKQSTNLNGRYALSGHLHPSVRLHGKAKQMIKLPCFWFRTQGAYLPAFGQFTGSQAISPEETDRVYVLTDSKVIEIS